MNTVNHAKRYGRTVFAVPGAIFSPLCGGTNQLLDEGQAHAASSAAPILRHLGIEPAPQVACRRERPATPKLNLSAEAKVTGGLYFILYNPVKKFMDQRSAHYAEMDKAAADKLAAAEKLEAEHQAQLDNLDEELRQRRAESQKIAQDAAQQH